MTIVHLQNCIFINGIYFPLCLIFFYVNILDMGGVMGNEKTM